MKPIVLQSCFADTNLRPSSFLGCVSFDLFQFLNGTWRRWGTREASEWARSKGAGLALFLAEKEEEEVRIHVSIIKSAPCFHPLSCVFAGPLSVLLWGCVSGRSPPFPLLVPINLHTWCPSANQPLQYIYPGFTPTRHQSVGSTCIVQNVLQPFPRIVNSDFSLRSFQPSPALCDLFHDWKPENMPYLIWTTNRWGLCAWDDRIKTTHSSWHHLESGVKKIYIWKHWNY